ncbi:serine--tRNA ligase [Aquabacter sediminis]|uniref:serine--tRNA ligase n=1 Tax=Aquabacter sediminis TaxID=3029197 RepID=UPI00237D62AE|nr:serine--tRNA ligase [Aquabacter sp. P-9]MDE1566712.1 serine--tRNA ligase [Aquabacter sp. P-9]
MHDIKWIREAPEGLVEALVRRQVPQADAVALRDRLIGLDEDRRARLTTLEGLLARRNAASKEIGAAKAAKDEAKAAALMAEVARIKEDVPALEAEVKAIEASLTAELAAIPNVPLDSVPEGKDEHDNVELRVVGEKRTYAFTPKQHFEVGEGLGLMDFETASKLSGARFVVNKGSLARLERALGQFFLDVHTGEHGYTEVNPPLLVRDEVMFGTAQLPKFADDQFLAGRLLSDEARHGIYKQIVLEDADLVAAGGPSRYLVARDGLYGLNEAGLKRFEELSNGASSLWLIPTAEVPLTNLVREAILSEDELPLRLTACTPCFRAEAGAAGRDTRGMIRQHQFTKVELVSITTPEKSQEEHERMLACAEAVLKKLDLHYRVVTLCTGDMGFASQKTYDIEVWLPGQNAFREISSCSVCGDFQARRMNARFRAKDGKAPRFVHTLNGSGVAVGRALVAVLETYQQEDGSVAVPDALLPYMGGVTKLEKVK